MYYNIIEFNIVTRGPRASNCAHLTEHIAPNVGPLLDLTSLFVLLGFALCGSLLDSQLLNLYHYDAVVIGVMQNKFVGNWPSSNGDQSQYKTIYFTI